MNEVHRLMDEVINFRDERDWAFHHNPKDLTLSLSLEASELLEVFQWISSEEALETKKTEMEEELADVLIYALTFAHASGIDVSKAIEDKLVKNAVKYPILTGNDTR
ncbi:nucleotide pyrophosphohydrolase [Exiguobacterium sp. AT1b]|uniref:nucleotide pyrophosphohydrolase n=1 Tax=Exiguobacterium sp. (strain ATCC BAA-1283 / AT1b) TaxID=360911 RepID=UPI00093907DA|nr:nucleotide pyrophosphohydrolase [Exiguobacterium sp. AT1b]